MYHSHATGERLFSRFRPIDFTLKKHFPGVWQSETSDDVTKRRFAGTVSANDAVYLSSVYVQRDVAENPGSIAFRDIVYLQ